LQSKTGANARHLLAAVQWLRNGGLLAAFPSGEVAHWQIRANRVVDPPWSAASARLARIGSATLIPAWFSGANSLGFQLAGLLHPNFRTAALPAELINKRGKICAVRFGTPLEPSQAAAMGSDGQVTEYLRAHSSLLGHSRFIDKTNRTSAKAISPDASGQA
jgi:putative hemolysin